MVDDTRYPMENILIHEMGHTVMWVWEGVGTETAMV